MERFLRPLHSLEAGQPPVYYVSAGAWLALGRALGLRDAALLYWARSLGGFACFALVLATWGVLGVLYPGRALIVWGAPLLVAAMPQDALYYITGDALSPLLGGLTFLGVARLMLRPDEGLLVYAFSGVALSAALLCKYPNAALYLPALLATAVALVSGRWAARRRGWPVFWLLAVVPPLAWFARNVAGGVGLTGTSLKAAKLGWTPKPLTEWSEHPLFSFEGVAVFLRDLGTTFWRGELVWQQETLALGGADTIYLVFSGLGLLLAVVALTRDRGVAPTWGVEWGALLALAAGIGVLALLSLAFVFEGTVHPSPGYPFFTNGRLIGGLLVPFCLLLVRGVESGAGLLPPRWRARAAWCVLGGVVAIACASELVLTAPVFGSAYNAYHLP